MNQYLVDCMNVFVLVIKQQSVHNVTMFLNVKNQILKDINAPMVMFIKTRSLIILGC